MLKKKVLIKISVLFMGINFSYGFTYKDCLSNKESSACDKSECLVKTKLNHSEKYFDVLLEYQLLCKEKYIREGIIRKKALWEQADFNPELWDHEGPSLDAIHHHMFGTETEKRKRRELLKKKVSEFRSFFHEMNQKWKPNKIEIKNYKVKAEFYKFLSNYPYEKRTFKTCLEHSEFDKCEKSLCLAMTKINKNFEYFKKSRDLSCENGEISNAVKMKYQQWLFDNGKHPEDWDVEGAPEHVLKTMIEM